MTNHKRRIEDRLFCPNCLMEGKRIIMKPLWKFDWVDGKVYLWFICPHRRRGEKGCGHSSVRDVKKFMSVLSGESRRKKTNAIRRRKVIKKRLKSGP